MKDIFELFGLFFKIGLFTFGGGYAMIPQIKREVIEKRKWITEEKMLEIIAIAEATPGPIAINMATYLGYQRKKFWGSVFATLGVVLPSLIIIFIISLFFNKVLNNKYVFYAFKGIKCAVAFLIVKTAIEMIIKMDKKLFPTLMLILVTVLSIIFELYNINFSSIYFIIIGAILGAIIHSKKVVEDNHDLS